jgi:hypothetical protein
VGNCRPLVPDESASAGTPAGSMGRVSVSYSITCRWHVRWALASGPIYNDAFGAELPRTTPSNLGVARCGLDTAGSRTGLATSAIVRRTFCGKGQVRELDPGRRYASEMRSNPVLA